jgi:hypothetical protein
LKRCTLSSATPIGANAVFLQIAKRYTPFSVLHQFFITFSIILAQMAAKHFYCKIQGCLLKIFILKYMLFEHTLSILVTVV